MCQFPRLPSAGYVFTDGWRRITGAGFSHSEIHGSKVVQHLTVAYRSRPRPSSSPGAKASTVCPYYLDGELLPDTSVQELGFFLHAPPPMSWGDAKSAPLARSARPSAVFKVHGGDQTGVSRRRL